MYVNGAVYQKLALVGRGGSSKVFKVISQQREIYALKRIRLSRTDRDTAKGFIDEIMLLQRLQGKSNIITLIDSEVRGRAKPHHSTACLRYATAALHTWVHSGRAPQHSVPEVCHCLPCIHGCARAGQTVVWVTPSWGACPLSS